MLSFFVRIAAIYLLWRTFYFIIGYESQPIEERFIPWLSAYWEGFMNMQRLFTLESTAIILGMFGFNTEIILEYMLRITDYRGGGVTVGNYCLAVQLMILYLALVLSYPAAVLRKVKYAIGGVALIQFVNVLRVTTLAWMSVRMPEVVEFNHHLTFRLLVLMIIMMIYFAYIRKS